MNECVFLPDRKRRRPVGCSLAPSKPNGYPLTRLRWMPSPPGQGHLCVEPGLERAASVNRQALANVG